MDAPSVPWTPEDLKPLFDQLLPTVEEMTVGKLTSKAEKANLPPEVVREIAKDAKWAPPARKALDIGCPTLAAKRLNAMGISAENKPEVIVGTALLTIIGAQVVLGRKLDKLIKAQNPQEKVHTATGS